MTVGGSPRLGNYELLDQLGEGGMGTVYRARDGKLDRIVALKVIRPERQKAHLMERFRREILATAQLQHPHIVRALDAEEIDGRLVLVMEYVEGVDLARLVQQRGPLPASEACEYIRQAAIALQYANERGVIHRDIKPSNLLLSAAPQAAVKLLDFGLARLTGPLFEDTDTMTDTGTLMGTPDFLSPEQAMKAHDVDIRSDLYSLGCTLYFLLTGRPPFPGGTVAVKLLRHQNEEPPSLDGHPNVPAPVAAVVRRLMAKRPEDRYQTPAELAEALTAVPPVAPSPAAFSETIIETSTLTPRRPRKRLLTVLAASLTGSIMVVVLVLMLANLLVDEPPDPNGPNKQLALHEEQLLALRKRVESGEPGKELRDALVQHRRTYAGGSTFLEAAALLSRLRSPLDDLDPARIPQGGRHQGLPKEVVAVLGEFTAQHGTPVRLLAVQFDNRLVASASEDGRIILWDPTTFRPRETLRMPKVWSLSFAPDVARLAAVSLLGGVQVWDTAVSPARLLHRFEGSSAALKTVVLGSAGKEIFAGGEQPGMRRWDLTASPPKALPDLSSDDKPVSFAALSADGKTLALGDQSTLRVFALTDREPKLRCVIPVPKAAFKAVALSGDGRVVAASNDNLLCWRIPPTGEPQSLGEKVDHQTVSSLVVSPDGKRIIAGGSHNYLRFYGVEDKALTVLHQAHGERAMPNLALTRDGTTLYTSTNTGCLRRWDNLENPSPSSVPDVIGHSVGVPLLSFGEQDDALTSAGYGWTIRWRPKAQAMSLDLKQSILVWTVAAHSPRAAIVLTAHEANVTNWIDNSNPITTPTQKHNICSVALSPDGRMGVSGCELGTLWQWDAHRNKIGLRLRASGHRIWAACWSPDGRVIAAASGEPGGNVSKNVALHAWNVNQQQEKGSVAVGTVHTEKSLHFTADGQRVAIHSEDRGLLLWTPGEKDAQVLISAQEMRGIRHFAFSPDGKLLATATGTTKLRLRDAIRGTVIRDIDFPEDVLPHRVAFAVDSRHLAVALSSGPILIVRLV